MRAEIIVQRTYTFKIDPEDYDDDITSWPEALDLDIKRGDYEDIGDFDETVEGRLLGSDPWPERAAGEEEGFL